MRPPRVRRLAAFAVVAALVAPGALRAQFPGAPGSGARAAGPSRWGFGLALSVAQPVHDFRRFVPNGWGGTGHVGMKLDPAGVLALRLDGGLLNYGREKTRVPLDRSRLDLQLETRNDIYWAAVGPQLMVPRGPIRPYVNAQLGAAVFTTSTTLVEERTFEEDRELDSVTEQSDGTWSWGGGGGVLLSVARGISLDLGARFHRNGRVSYLREGGVRNVPGGGVELDTIRSAADLWTYQVGLSLAW
ncbi:MAG TPA: outer membrane beta-barrel protein [Gemmatirosa sp.]|nr:outer membrane beta-barrel protein [Gemmatirosa sp.]